MEKSSQCSGSSQVVSETCEIESRQGETDKSQPHSQKDGDRRKAQKEKNPQSGGSKNIEASAEIGSARNTGNPGGSRGDSGSGEARSPTRTRLRRCSGRR
jgi:hypothetical protein